MLIRDNMEWAAHSSYICDALSDYGGAGR